MDQRILREPDDDPAPPDGDAGARKAEDAPAFGEQALGFVEPTGSRTCRFLLRSHLDGAG